MNIDFFIYYFKLIPTIIKLNGKYVLITEKTKKSSTGKRAKRCCAAQLSSWVGRGGTPRQKGSKDKASRVQLVLDITLGLSFVLWTCFTNSGAHFYAASWGWLAQHVSSIQGWVEHTVRWLMGWPAGLKLNENLGQRYWEHLFVGVQRSSQGLISDLGRGH